MRFLLTVFRIWKDIFCCGNRSVPSTLTYLHATVLIAHTCGRYCSQLSRSPYSLYYWEHALFANMLNDVLWSFHNHPLESSLWPPLHKATFVSHRQIPPSTGLHLDNVRLRELGLSFNQNFLYGIIQRMCYSIVDEVLIFLSDLRTVPSFKSSIHNKPFIF